MSRQQPSIPPSWEVLDAEAKELGLDISYETDPDTGQGYVTYTGNGHQISCLDHPMGRQCANERFEELNKQS